PRALGTLLRSVARQGSMKSGNGAGFAPGSTRAMKRDDERGRADAARAMRIRYHKVATVRVLVTTYGEYEPLYEPLWRSRLAQGSQIRCPVSQSAARHGLSLDARLRKHAE